MAALKKSGQSTPPGFDASDGLTGEEEHLDLTDLYDSEKLAIRRVMAVINQKTGTYMEGSAFQREVRERFAEIGFVVKVPLQKDMLDPRPWDDKPWIPRVYFVGRCEPLGEFDHEQMGHEVRSNILGVNKQGNVQKTQVAPGFTSTKSGLIVPGG